MLMGELNNNFGIIDRLSEDNMFHFTWIIIQLYIGKKSFQLYVSQNKNKKSSVNV